MKTLGLLALLALPLGAVVPQNPAPSGFQHWNSAFFTDLHRTLGEKAAADAHHLGALKFADYPSEALYEVHRAGDGAPELHETEADVIFVQSGSGILVVGGTLAGAETTAPHELRGGTIQGGARIEISAGDVLRIPAKTPHQVLLGGSKEINYIVVKAKGY